MWEAFYESWVDGLIVDFCFGEEEDVRVFGFDIVFEALYGVVLSINISHNKQAYLLLTGSNATNVPRSYTYRIDSLGRKSNCYWQNLVCWLTIWSNAWVSAGRWRVVRVHLGFLRFLGDSLRAGTLFVVLRV